MSFENGSLSNFAIALSKAIFTVRNRYELSEAITSERFANILAELNLNTTATAIMLEKINFAEGELKCDDLLARMELIRAAHENGGLGEEEALASDNNKELSSAFINGRDDQDLIIANSFAGSAESPLDPWRRTISQLSMTSILEPEMSCRVEVTIGEMTGPILDRHRTYKILVSSQIETVVRRYKDFHWLHAILIHKYPFRIVPQIPSKGSLGSNFLGSEEFITSRRRGLEEFLYLVLNHPILQKDSLVIEFLAVESFDKVRTRIQPTWQEEFTLFDHYPHDNQIDLDKEKDEDNTCLAFKDADWTVYEDAQEWTANLKDTLISMKRSFGSLSIGNASISDTVKGVSENIKQILSTTQHTDTIAGNVSSLFESLSRPHQRVSEIFIKNSARLELFLRLVIASQETIYRTRKMKFDRFTWLSEQIVNAQATTEKLRARDGGNFSPELEKALNRVSLYQRDLVYQSRRNEFADACLKQELGWAVKIFKSLPALFTEIQSALHQQYLLLNEVTNH